jgi:hypothetical protein
MSRMMINPTPLNSAQMRVEEATRWLRLAVSTHENLGEDVMADIDALEEARSDLSSALATLHDAGIDRYVAEVAVNTDGSMAAVLSDLGQWPVSAKAEETLRRLGLSLLRAEFRWEDFTEEFIVKLESFLPETFGNELAMEMAVAEHNRRVLAEFEPFLEFAPSENLSHDEDEPTTPRDPPRDVATGSASPEPEVETPDLETFEPTHPAHPEHHEAADEHGPSM